MNASVLRLDNENDDLLVSIGLAVGLHVVLLLVMVFAGWWQPAVVRPSVAGPVIEASLVISSNDVAVAEEAAATAPKPEPVEATPPPQPQPVPVPQDEPAPPQPTPQEQLLEPDTVDQEEVARLAVQAAEEEQRKVQEARQRQEQIDLTERLRQEQIQRRKEAERRELAEIQRRRDEAAKRTRMEEQRLAQLAERNRPEPTPAPPPGQRIADAPPVAAAGTGGVDTDLLARYQIAIQQAIQRNWIRPETVSPGAVCPLRIIQSRGGTVISVEVLPGCAYDALGQRSVEAAVLRAQPLPYQGFESVYRRDLRLNFRATEN